MEIISGSKTFDETLMPIDPPNMFLLTIVLHFPCPSPSLLSFAIDRSFEDYFLSDCPCARSQAWMLRVLHGYTNGWRHAERNVLRWYTKTCENGKTSSWNHTRRQTFCSQVGQGSVFFQGWRQPSCPWLKQRSFLAASQEPNRTPFFGANRWCGLRSCVGISYETKE